MLDCVGMLVPLSKGLRSAKVVLWRSSCILHLRSLSRMTSFCRVKLEIIPILMWVDSSTGAPIGRGHQVQAGVAHLMIQHTLVSLPCMSTSAFPCLVINTHQIEGLPQELIILLQKDYLLPETSIHLEMVPKIWEGQGMWDIMDHLQNRLE